jgi:hypothetical protein
LTRAITARRGGVALAALALAAALSPLAAQTLPKRPPAGVAVDQSMTRSLITRLPQPCVSLATAAATIILPRRELQAEADARPAKINTVAGQEAALLANRAAGVLKAVGSTPDAFGCAPLDANAAKGAGSDVQTTVGDYLERGRATVIPAGQAVPVRAITVRYLGTHPGPMMGRGEIQFLLRAGEAPFFTLTWWAS